MSILLFSACSNSTSPPKAEIRFSLEVDDLPEAMLALVPLDATGSELLAVGGPLGNSGPPALLLRDDESSTWTRVAAPPGWDGAIWWGWAASAEEVCVVGDRAQIARGPVDTLSRIDTSGVMTSTTTTLYGVWGTSARDLWIVGGDSRRNQGLILRWDGSVLQSVHPTGSASVALDRLLLKVWGTAADDITIVGDGGLAIHYDGSAWTREDTTQDERLVTVHGRARDERYTVGGLNQGVVLADNGSGWKNIADPFAPPLNGVFAAMDGSLWVSGASGYLASWKQRTWSTFDTDLSREFHAVFVSPSGTFGVGGILALEPGSRRGFVGRASVSSE